MENQRSLFIGNAIRTARKQQKITQEDLAKLVGVGKSYISKCEKGYIKNIRHDILLNLNSILNLDLSEEYLIDLSNLTGKRFSMLTVVSFDHCERKQRYWKCKCDCGNYTIVSTGKLNNGEVKSCGCLRAIENKSRAKHNMSRSRIYSIYHSMIKRCYSINCASYPRYGGRGITVCDNWLDKTSGFENFYAWACASGYAEHLSLDRINVNDGYSPQNCRWATAKEQANNRTNTPHITYNGLTKTPAEWAAIYHIDRQVILNRYKKGLREKELFSYTAKK